MGRYLLRRLAVSIPVLIGITIATYLIANMAPGDPVTALLNLNLLGDVEDLLELEAALLSFGDVNVGLSCLLPGLGLPWFVNVRRVVQDRGADDGRLCGNALASSSTVYVEYCCAANIAANGNPDLFIGVKCTVSAGALRLNKQLASFLLEI